MVRSRLAVLLSVVATVLLPAAAAAPAAAAPAAGAPAAGASVAGGDTLRSAAGASCLLGFNTSGRGILTSGRCGPVGARWYLGATSVGVTSTVFAGKDAALISIDNPAVTQLHGVRGGLGLVMITSAARAYVGQTVGYFSGTSGTRTGRVTALNVTVNYAEGAITGLDRTNLCASSRDGGSPIIAGSVGLSILSGGSTGCTGGAVYAQPIAPLLAALGRTLF